MVEIITFIIDLLIIAGVVFAVLFIRKRLSQHPGRKYMPIAFFILFGIIIVASSATVIYSTKNLPKDYKTHISSKILIQPYDILKTLGLFLSLLDGECYEEIGFFYFNS